MREQSTIRALLVAVQFLTRVPVPDGHRPATADTLRRAIVFFPLVGAGIGLVTASSMLMGLMLWPAFLAAMIALAVEALMTGAFHEDAVGDFFDAFGGGYTRERVLEILKDSRIGSFGTVALCLALVLRGGAMASLPGLGAGAWTWLWQEGLWLALAPVSAIIAAATLARWVIVLAMAVVPPVENRASLAKDVGAQANGRDIMVATVLAIPGTLLWAMHMPGKALISLVLLLLLTWWFARIVRRTLGGITGDCLGCLAYAAQILVLLVAAADM